MPIDVQSWGRASRNLKWCVTQRVPILDWRGHVCKYTAEHPVKLDFDLKRDACAFAQEQVGTVSKLMHIA